MKKITIQVKHYFDGVYMYVGVLLAMVGLIFLLFDVYIAIISLFLSLLVFSTTYKLSVYKDAKQYHDYLWLLGIKKGYKTSYDSVDKLLITKQRYKRRLNSRGSSSVIEYDLFKGFVVFDGDKKVLLGESKNPVKIEKRVALLRDELGVEVHDLREN